ncbi:MAG: YeiH family protein [Spirochaetia bacterium]|nr:YeiH family protein [Spirochaetia bacterium]
MSENKSEIVVDHGKSSLSDLWKSEDYLAIWLGALILITGIAIFFPRSPEGMHEKIQKNEAILLSEAQKSPFKTIEWFKASDAKSSIKATNGDFAKPIKAFLGKTHGWSSNPMHAFVMGEADAEEKKKKAVKNYEEAKILEEQAFASAVHAQSLAEEASFKNKELNAGAKKAISGWRTKYNLAAAAKKKTKVKPYNQIFYLIGLCAVLTVFFGAGMFFMKKRDEALGFFKGFPFVFLLAVIAYWFAGQSNIKELGIGYAAWAILFGLIISNTVGTPKWIKHAVQTEYFIKTGLVLLGAEILFGKILTIGIPGIFIAWIVTPIVLVVTFIFGQKVLKIPSPTLNMVISADMSVCGVSAAIATASACRAKKEELTLSVGLSLVFTSVMMIVMPAVIKYTNMDHVLGGAWMGGTIDATGAVAAAGAFLSDRALYTAATIKMIQNILIGVIAFAIAVFWAMKYDKEAGKNITKMEIWHRFPKFVIGFIAASIIFSLMYNYMGPSVGDVMIDNGVIRGFSKNLRGWFFNLAFVSIGLATDFRKLASYFAGGKPLILYVCGQSLNLTLTLIMAYIMFFLVFPEIAAAI